MELFWSKCSIFHIIIKYMIFQRRHKALLWSKGLKKICPLQIKELKIKVDNVGEYPIQKTGISFK